MRAKQLAAMSTKQLGPDELRTWVIVCGTGDEVMTGLAEFARSERLSAAGIQGIGALSDVTLGYFDWEAKDYDRVRLEEQVEVLSLLGDVALEDDSPQVHVHIVVGKRDGTAHGGHLMEGHVRPTLELLVTETPVHLRKRIDPASGLALIDPGS
jgi:predicted DNA-binding protein with PD1-like motif